MSINIGTLLAKIMIDTKGLKRATKTVTSASDNMSKSFKKTQRSASGLSTTMKTLAGSAAILGGIKLGKGFVEAAAEAENFSTRLNVIFGSVKKGNELFKDMSMFASQVPFEFNKVLGGATQLAGVMKGGIKEINTWMPLIGDLAATTGLDIKVAMGQFIRMYSAGAQAADMFRERGILNMLGFRASVRYTAKETQRMLMEAWNKVGSRFKGATAELAKTWIGLTSMMSDAWFLFRIQVMDQGMFDNMKAGIKLLIDEINELRKNGTLEKWAKQLSEHVRAAFTNAILVTAAFYDTVSPLLINIGRLLSSLFKSFFNLPPWIQEIGIITAFLGGKKGAVAILAVSSSLDHVASSARGLAAVTTGDLSMKDYVGMTTDELSAFLKKQEELWGNMEEAPKKVITSIEELYQAIGNVDSAVEGAKILLQYISDLGAAGKKAREEAGKFAPGKDSFGMRSEEHTPINMDKLQKENEKRYATIAKFRDREMKLTQSSLDYAEWALEAENAKMKKVYAEKPGVLKAWHAVYIAEEKAMVEEAAQAKLDIIKGMKDEEKQATMTSWEYDIWALKQKDIEMKKSLAGQTAALKQWSATYKATMADLQGENLWKDMKEAIADWSNNLSDAFVDIALGAETSFEDIFESFRIMILKMLAQKALLGGAKMLFGGGPIGALFGFAKGAVVGGSNISKHSNSIVSSPTTFAFASGAGLMGEDGREAIMPMSGGGIGARIGGRETSVPVNRLSNGDLGVDIDSDELGGAGLNITVPFNIIQQDPEFRSGMRDEIEEVVSDYIRRKL